MEKVATALIALVFVVIVIAGAYFLIRYGIGSETDYLTSVLTGGVFLAVIFGVVAISYFASRGNS